MGDNLHLGREKSVNVNLNKAQAKQLDFITREYGMSMSEVVIRLIRQEAVKLCKREKI
jgi:hypothetical protein